MHKRNLTQTISLFGALALLPAWTAEPHHLFVDEYDASGKTVAILRFPLHDGLPAPAPDLTIENQGYIAGVAPDGEVYSGKGIGTFFAFHGGATKPYRRFHIKLPQYNFVSASSVDPRGNFWIEYWEPSAGPRGIGSSDGAAAYSPRAHGDVQPIQQLARGGSFGLAFNSRGDLFADGFYRGLAVVAFKDPLEKARIVRAYRGEEINYQGALLAVNSDDEVFIQSGVAGSKCSIAVFAPGADPAGPPTNVIQTSFSEVHLFGLAAGPRYAYVIDGDANALEVYAAQQNGPQQPVASISAPSGLFFNQVVVGP